MIYGILAWHKVNVEMVILNGMVIGGGTFGWYLGHKGEVLMNGITALTKGTFEALSFFLLCEGLYRS